ncbi:MAG: HAD family hydrolase [Thermomicrobiales bacterium]|nr:HAD family hydrolase [Thermomicrobiales bacterium]
MNAQRCSETVEVLTRLEGQHLLIDADDTLWENNIYFNRAIDAFIDFLDHSSMPPDRVRLVLQEIELENLTVHGYGSAAFGRSLQSCYQKLSERHVSDEDIETILGFAEEIMLQEIDLLPGVEETLPMLADRHELVLFTKGSDAEQRQKIDKSGIDMHFLDAIVVPEKDETVYREIVSGRSWESGRTWMIGNSPKSDINPALAAGINAVFIPHHSTWELELQDLNGGPGRFLQLAGFRELLDHF